MEEMLLQKNRLIRTMANDITRLREEEVRGEREKIMGLRAGDETKRRALEETRKAKEEREKAEFLLKLKRMEESEKEALEAEAARRREMEKTKVSDLLEDAKKREGDIKRRIGLEEEEGKRKREEEFLRRAEEERRQGMATTSQLQREKEERERADFLKRVAEERVQRPTPEMMQTSSDLPGREMAREEKFPLRPDISIPRIGKTIRTTLIAKAPPQRASTFEKFFVRVLIIGFLMAIWAGIFTFWYWFLTKEKTTLFPPSSEVEEETVSNPEPVVPSSLIPVTETKTLEIASTEELESKLSEFLKVGGSSSSSFYRILIKNSSENKILDMKEVFDALQVKAPETFYQKINLAFTFFLYPSEEYNRLGFVAEVNEGQDLSTFLKSWEGTMEEDFETLFTLIDKQGPSLISYFRTAKYQGVSFRFQTFSKKDMGICYAILGSKLIWTSSWESLTKVIDLLK